MVVNPTKSKAICFTRGQVREPLSNSLRDLVIPEASSCKCLGIILRGNYIGLIKLLQGEESLEGTFHFIMRILQERTGKCSRPVAK
jgi:hypothetical protein